MSSTPYFVVGGEAGGCGGGGGSKVGEGRAGLQSWGGEGGGGGVPLKGSS